MLPFFNKKSRVLKHLPKNKKKTKKKKKPMFVVSLMCLYQSDVNPTQFVTLVSWGIYIYIYIYILLKIKSQRVLKH